MLQRQFAAPGKQFGLHPDQVVHQGAGRVAVDGVGLEQRLPAAQAVAQWRQQRIVGVEPAQCCAHRRKPLWIRDEILVSALGPGESVLVVRGRHVGRPEQVFLGLVNHQVGVVEVVEQLLCSLQVVLRGG